MQTVLFHSTIFGPIHSRRLGVSLGVNLSPDDGKICTFDCLYCEAGFNAQGPGTTGLPLRESVAEGLEHKLAEMKEAGSSLDVITFSGNGEPTVHPDFPAIIDDTLRIRDKYYPEAKVSVLSNSTRIGRPEIFKALLKVDNNILKLDSAITETIHQIDRPTLPHLQADTIIANLAEFGNDCIVQTMLLRGEYDGKAVDNTTPKEIEALIEAYSRIQPSKIMIYSIDRTTPARQLVKVSREELEAIGERIKQETGIPVLIA